jgi:uncharacterized protein
VREEPIVNERTVAAAAREFEQFTTTLPPSQAAALQGLLARAASASASLGDRPPESILSARELTEYEELKSSPLPPTAMRRPVLTVVMKATRLCNLRCTYCHSWRDGPNQIMSFAVLARTIRSALQPGMRHVEFVWHGGEATLLPIDFYRKALWLQEQFRLPGQSVANSIQTNGTRLTPEWLEFLRVHHFSVGVSLDGPPEVHDLRRIDIAGRPTSARVREGLDQLRAAGVGPYGILMVVDEDVVALGAERVLTYLLELDVGSVALLNVLPENIPAGESLTGSYLPFPAYIEFLREMFRLWWPQHASRLKIRELSTLIAQLRGGRPEICIFAGDCFGSYLTIEPAGDISACDKYIGDSDYHFGNVLRTEFSDLQRDHRLTVIQNQNRIETDAVVEACRWSGICHGACPHDRYTGTRHTMGYDSTCCGYAPLLEEMAESLDLAVPANRSAATHVSLDLHNGTSRQIDTQAKGA